MNVVRNVGIDRGEVRVWWWVRRVTTTIRFSGNVPNERIDPAIPFGIAFGAENMTRRRRRWWLFRLDDQEGMSESILILVRGIDNLLLSPDLCVQNGYRA